MQHVKDFGNSLIEPDIKRLKRLKSLQEDLGTYFTAHINQLETFGRLSCQITADKEYVVCKERIAITRPRLSPSKGCRLWFVITRNSGYYIRCLLYSASEEKTYQKSVCFKLVTERLETLLF